MIDLLKDLIAGRRIALAKAMTLIESENTKDQKKADELLAQIALQKKSSSFRIGISGVPGVGKSSLIEKLGLLFIKENYKVAVLAVDPSSEISKGSILGDKTRMDELSKCEDAFIRPSANRGQLGGIAVSTRDMILLCEAAGYQVIIIETVGVGQSESIVADLTDYFLFLSLPGAGDELQGIKKGVLERIDGVVVNKCEGSHKVAAELAQKQLQSALKILRAEDIPVLLTSALTGYGVNELGEFLLSFWAKNKDHIAKKRLLQESLWIKYYVEQFFALSFAQERESSSVVKKIEQQVSKGQLTARMAAREILKSLFSR